MREQHPRGEPTENWAPLFDTGTVQVQTAPTDADETADSAPESGDIPVFGPPEFIPGTYPYLSRWRFVLVVAGVWLVAAAAGAGLYEWWFAALDKTAPVFVVLVFLVVCAVAGLLVSLIRDRPLTAAVALALMSAPLAATAAAALLYGSYVFGWFGR